MIEAFPLSWPHDWPRTKFRKASGYKVSLDVALEDLLHELELMGARAIIVSSNVPLRRDGGMYRDERTARVHAPGVAVYWDARDGTPNQLACAHWLSVRETVRALGLVVEGMRLIERCGATQLIKRAFTGFARLPAGSERKPWWEVLGVNPDASRDSVVKAYLELTRRHHPDRGGTTARMAEINVAYQEALQGDS